MNRKQLIRATPDVADLAFAAAFAAVVLWLRNPAAWWAIVAFVAGAALLALVFVGERWVLLPAVLVLIAGDLAAMFYSGRMSDVDTRWPSVREQLIQKASVDLNGRLTAALQVAEDASRQISMLEGLQREDAFVEMERISGRIKLDNSIVRFGLDGQPWAWGGTSRMPPSPEAGTSAFVSPFLAVLQTTYRSDDGHSGVASVVLWADSTLPDIGVTVSDEFRASTGSDLRFYSPSGAPDNADVFDYCVPDCDPHEGVPDTLFSVRAIPPGQGEVKLEILDRSGRLVAWLLILAALATLLDPRVVARRIAVVGLIGAAIFSPAGRYVGLGDLFSPAVFFVDALGPLSESAGNLFLVSALALFLVVGLWRRRMPRNRVGFIGSVILVAAAPYSLRIVAHGITPARDTGPLLWLGWEVVVTVTSSAFILLAAALIRGKDAEIPKTMSFVAVAWAATVAIVGLFLWSPGPSAAWPEWYPFLWIPALIIAVQPAPTPRMVTTVGIVAGCAASLLSWGATVEGRMVLADREIAALGGVEDIGRVGALEDFSEVLKLSRPPRTESDLFSLWNESGLKAGDYPTSIASVDRTDRELTRLDLARLDIPSGAFDEIRGDARRSGEPEYREIRLPLGVHAMVAVPFPDGSVVTAAAGPASTLLPATGLGRLLGLNSGRTSFRMSLSTGAGEAPVQAPRWDRNGWVVTGVRRLVSQAGDRTVSAEISLLGPGHLLVRGTLAVIFDVIAILILWAAGEVLAGKVEITKILRGRLRLSAYRTRLGLALTGFFVMPTVGFAVWSLVQLNQSSDERQASILSQELADLAAIVPGGPEAPYRAALFGAATRFQVDLSLYEDGILTQTSNRLLPQLGLKPPLMPPEAFTTVALRGGRDRVVGSSSGEVNSGYRALPSGDGRSHVLALTSRVAARELHDPLEDLVFTVLLVSLLGFAAAVWLASVTAATMTRPLRALREAAAAVGQGQAVVPVRRPIPAELDPVVETFERMANDVREHQNALESTARFTQAVLRNLATGVIALGRDIGVATANPRAEELLVCTLATGVPIDAQTSEKWASVWEWVRRFIAGVIETDVKEFTIDGRRIKVLAALLEGSESGCVVVLDDVTDLSRAERVLAWGEMARQVAHEIKNPLTPIRLGVQHLLRVHANRREDFGQMLENTSNQILAEIERLDSIARGFARFGSPDTSQQPLERVDLVGVARDAVALYEMGGDGSVTLSGTDRAEGMARTNEFREVLVNLIENSRDAGARSVEVEVSAIDDREVRIAVRDDGEGISPELLPHVFEPSFSTTTSGTGLGLAICRRLVESWGGSIAVANNEHKGTTVTMSVNGPAAGADG